MFNSWRSTWSIAMAKAPSVPGTIGIHSSAFSALGLKNGSMHTCLMPRTRASAMRCALPADFFHPGGHRFQRLFPTDLNPSRIDFEPLFRIGPLERHIDSVRIIQGHDSADSAGTKPSPVGGGIRIAFYFYDGSVDTVDFERADAIAKDAGGVTQKA